MWTCVRRTQPTKGQIILVGAFRQICTRSIILKALCFQICSEKSVRSCACLATRSQGTHKDRKQTGIETCTKTGTQGLIFTPGSISENNQIGSCPQTRAKGLSFTPGAISENNQTGSCTQTRAQIGA